MNVDEIGVALFMLKIFRQKLYNDMEMKDFRLIYKKKLYDIKFSFFSEQMNLKIIVGNCTINLML